MAVGERVTASRAVGPPRAMAWVVLLASAGAVLIVGLLATGLVLGSLDVWPAPPLGFWARFLAACSLTAVSLSLRSLRWIFLLRRSETRIPIRDAYIGYFSGFSLLIAPLLIGEIAVRALVLRARGRVPILTTTVVNIWERALDLVALVTLTVCIALASGNAGRWSYVAIAVIGASFVGPFRRLALLAIVVVGSRLTAVFEPAPPLRFDRLAGTWTWVTAFAASVVAWVLPGVGFWILSGGWGQPFGMSAAQETYAASALSSGLVVAPGGVLVAGGQMLAALIEAGVPDTSAALSVLATRLATAGLSMALGVVFVLIHMRTSGATTAAHFDDIADAYDVQIPAARRLALLEKKTDLMREWIVHHRVGRKGLDVGCGQGAYVARMRSLGFDVSGIDTSAAQLRRAALAVDDPTLVSAGSVLDIPGPDQAFDFLYVINVLHHLGSVEEQRRAFNELFRVLKPGGLLFVHEINTRNVLFRFYMGYIFPSLNCIDEGVERWLLPNRLAQYTGARIVGIHHFTFLPDFLPRIAVRILTPLESLLERSPLRVYSAHYMAVFEKEPRRTQ
jgi:ubiquinone/menaquinone biosynthesis C-methylase UbiE